MDKCKKCGNTNRITYVRLDGVPFCDHFCLFLWLYKEGYGVEFGSNGEDDQETDEVQLSP